MKTRHNLAVLGLCIALAGCGSRAPEKAAADAQPAAEMATEAIELNADEAALLAEPAPAAETSEPVTPANYKQALADLEAELASEQ